MADLGLYFGEEDDEQLEQDDKALSYLVLNNDQDDSFDPVDTENLLAQMSGDSLLSHGIELDENTDVVRLFADLSFTPSEKISMFAKSEHDFHRSFLARELSTLLPQMRTHEAIMCVIPVVRELAIDHVDTVRETLASQLDKIVLYFLRHTQIDDTLTDIPLDQYSQLDNHEHDSSELPLLPPGFFTSVFVSLLLEQNEGIAHHAKLAVISVAENVPENLLESEILDGVLAGLSDLYRGTETSEGDSGNDPYGPSKDQHDDEAVIGKAVVVVLLTSLARLLGQKRCVEIVVPTLEKLLNTSPFYVQKEIVLALGELSLVVSQEFLVEKLLPLFEGCAQNESWHVRRACCNVLASFTAAMPADLRATKVVEMFETFLGDVSRSVRISTTEILGAVIASFDQGKASVVLTAGRSKWEEMKPVYMRLAGTFRSPIRRTLACSLHEIARILGPELADRDLALAFADCLKAEGEIKEAVLGHVVEFIACLSPEVRSSCLQDIRDAWIEMEKSSNWRLRDSLAGHLPALCETASGQDLLQVLIPLSVLACTDSVSTIRESGVMSFPALWEASSRIGTIPVPAKQENALEHDQEEDDEDKAIGGLGSFHQAGDEDLDDFEDGPRPMMSFDQDSDDDMDRKDAVKIENIKDHDSKITLVTGESAVTTIRDQVIQQTIDFAVNGGFRSRVVAVQIIQSLLDHGITVAEFEEHFLTLMAETLAVDPVVNVRIWVARVVSWILESKYYGDEPVAPRLHDLLTALQQDSDRDVRIYSGGPAELPKPKKKKKSSKDKKKKKAAKASVFHQNPKAGQVATIQEEDEEGDVQLLFDDGENMEDDDSDEDSDDDDDDDDDDDSDDDEDSDDSTEYLKSAKAGGISNKPRNRNSFGIGMKVMVGDKLTVSGKEIRRPKTSWDYVQDQVEDDTNTEVADFSGLGEQAKEGQLDLLDFGRDGEDTGESNEPGSFDMPRSTLAMDDFEDDTQEEDSGFAKVIPYTTHAASGASPLDVEMEESFDSSVANRTDSGFDGELSDVNIGEDGVEYMDQDEPHQKHKVATLANGSAHEASEHSTEDKSNGFPPLSGSNGPTSSVVVPSPSTISYAALVKNIANDESKGFFVNNNTSSLTSFSQVNIPEPRPSKTSSPAVTVAAAGTGQYTPLSSASSSPAPSPSPQHPKERTPEEEVLRVLSAKLSAGPGKKLSQLNLLPSPLSIAGLDRVKDLNSRGPVGLLSPGVPPISYASVVASGATSSTSSSGAPLPRPPMHATFSPPMSPPMATPHTFSF
ncbi:Serine/threonine-protein phosphatase 4 regulatory subunit 1 [Podila minutissima]|uniref:Serine/threonine-protein phosphatase 4 regulatory subunit 1 n=1 Tax=Podila minutissima TaxID=64525 RepID=A0A9P5SJM7_9FUNG|nr:Serine/threonine-protein phosphatase 4 regulatory subunit 1 [Podila minutissima]